VVELIGRLVNQVKSQQGGALAEVTRHSNPPVDHLFLIPGIGLAFKSIGLVSNDRDNAVLPARLDQLTQVDEPRFAGLPRHANTHVAYPLRAKITHHQRVELADTALGMRPVHVHADAQLLRIAGRGQRRLVGQSQA